MNKWFLSLVLLSFGTSVFAQSMAQTNPFNYYKTDNIFKTDIDVKPKKLPNLSFNVKYVNLNNDLSRSEEHNISGQYSLKMLGGSAGVKFSNNKDFLTQNINQTIGLNYGINRPNTALSLTVNAYNSQPLIGQQQNNTIAELKGTIKL